MECEYCQKTFTSKVSLNKHQKTAKYCLNKRSNIIEDIECKYCSKKFARQDNLVRHQRNCHSKIKYQEKENYIKTLEDKLKKSEDRIQELEKIIEKTSQKSTVIQRISKLEILTSKYFRNQSKYLTESHIEKGLDGLVDYAVNYPLKNRLICTDKNRYILKYLSEEGLEVDVELKYLRDLFFKSIKVPYSVLHSEYLRNLEHNIKFTDEDVDNKKRKLLPVLNMIFRISDKKESILFTEFLKLLCITLYNSTPFDE